MKNKKIITIISFLLIISLTGCGTKETVDIITDKTSSNVDIYVSDDVDVFGEKLEGNDYSVVGESSEKNNEINVISENKENNQKEELKVYYLDVGQADCILIQVSNDENILIDGGNNEDGEDIVSYLKYLGIEKLDTIIATHPHEDHIGGLDTIMDSIDTEKIYFPFINEKDMPTTVTYEDFMNSIDKNEVIPIISKNNDIIYEKSNISLKILSPDEVETGDLNDYSIVVQLDFYDNNFLFEGDASNKINDYIKENYDSKYLDIDVLKMGHHGSNTSTNDNWLKTITPSYAIIMCGTNNKYGHPHREVTDYLKNLEIEKLQTNENGTILITSDGENITVKTKITGDIPFGEEGFNIENMPK